MIDYKQYITIEPGKRSGKPCIRGLRITVYDVLNMLADGMSYDEILDDYPKLTKDDILACLAFAANIDDDTYLRTIDGMVKSIQEARAEPIKNGVTLDKLAW